MQKTMTMKGKLSLSELLMADENEEITVKQENVKYAKLLSMDFDETLREKLLKKEFALRKKQPEPWTKTKYRPFANFKARRSELDQALETKQAKANKKALAKKAGTVKSKAKPKIAKQKARKK
jgi:Fe-S oxidoreductase